MFVQSHTGEQFKLAGFLKLVPYAKHITRTRDGKYQLIEFGIDGVLENGEKHNIIQFKKWTMPEGLQLNLLIQDEVVQFLDAELDKQRPRLKNLDSHIKNIFNEHYVDYYLNKFLTKFESKAEVMNSLQDVPKNIRGFIYGAPDEVTTYVWLIETNLVDTIEKEDIINKMKEYYKKHDANYLVEDQFTTGYKLK